MMHNTETIPAALTARLRAAGPPPSFDYLHDPGLLQRLMPSDVVIDDSEDAEPVKRKRRPTLAAPLPPTLPPRLVRRDAAAAYVGVSPNTFDKMIADGLMPKPRQLTERRLAWDVQQLDAAIDRLPVDGGTDTETDTSTDHSWDDIDAQAKTKSPVH